MKNPFRQRNAHKFEPVADSGSYTPINKYVVCLLKLDHYRRTKRIDRLISEADELAVTIGRKRIVSEYVAGRSA